MEKVFYFECECGGRAIHRLLIDAIDGNNIFNVKNLEQTVFECEKCGKKYYCGDWEDFCTDEI